MKATHLAVRLIRASQKAYTRKLPFLVTFFLIFFTTTGVLAALDVLPNIPVANADPKVMLAATVTPNVPVIEKPIRIEIPAIALKQPVANPDSADVAVLDHALLQGPVRYPSSSNLGEAGNVIIFGHSSYLPVVNNQAFKAFDGIQKLVAGDTIKVYGEERVYVYAVDTVEKADANADAIPLRAEGSLLTLATCDSFGTKSSRFIVTAHLVGSNLIGA